MTFENYSYDGRLKRVAAEKRKCNDSSNKTATGYDEFEEVLQNKMNIIKVDPDARYNAGLDLGDPDTADIRIVGLGYSGSGNSSLMLRLFYNEFDDEPDDNALLQWEQHQMNYSTANDHTLRISYFDLKGFDDILSKQQLEERIENTINDSFNVVLLYYSIENRTSFEDSNGYSVQDIKLCVDRCLNLVDSAKFKLVLVALKLDTESDGDRKVSTTEGRQLADEWKVPFVELSSKTGVGIQQLVDIICTVYKDGFEDIDGEDTIAHKTKIKADEEYILENKEEETPIVDEIAFVEEDRKEVAVINNDVVDKQSNDIAIVEGEEKDKDEVINKQSNDAIYALNTMNNGKPLIDGNTSLTEPLIPAENKPKKQCCSHCCVFL